MLECNGVSQTFVFSTIPLVLCYYLNLIPFSFYIIFQTFIAIQLVEYFLWTYLNTSWNAFFSKIGLFLIVLLVWNSLYFSNIPYKTYILVFYLCFVAYVLTYPIKFHTSIAKNKHLSWEWFNYPLSIIFVWSMFLYYPPSMIHISLHYIQVSLFLLRFTLIILAIHLVLCGVGLVI